MSDPVHSLIIRPIKESDLNAILNISTKVGPSISLPHDADTLSRKINRSIQSFAEKNPVHERAYFLVLEDCQQNEIMGTAMVEVKAASLGPFYNFTILPIVEVDHQQKNQKLHHILIMTNQYQEASILRTLYLDARLRGKGQGKVLSRARCLLIAEHPELFSNLIIANMQGVFDATNHSPFWEGLSRHFFGKDYSEAHRLHETGQDMFIEDLAPMHPIYLELLPKEVQEVIGKTHQDTAPALHVLEKEGMMYRDVIDIFDGGPIIEVPKTCLRALRESRLGNIKTIQKTTENLSRALLYNRRADLRVVLGYIQVLPDQTLVIDAGSAAALELGENDSLRYYFMD